MSDRVTRLLRAQHGFGYLLVLGTVAVTGIGLAAAGLVWSTMAKREREAELLFAGAQIRDAIERYYDAGPSAAKRLPQSLDDLLVDRRHPRPMHHLRRLYADPMTRDGRWVLVQVPGQGIVGVHSASRERPLREIDVAGLTPGPKRSYAEWRFVVARLGGLAAGGVSPQTASTSPLAPLATSPQTTTPTITPAPTVVAGAVQVETPPKPRARIPPEREACRNLAFVDNQRCANVTLRRGNGAGETCFASADTRMRACNATQAPPPLDVGQ